MTLAVIGFVLIAMASSASSESEVLHDFKHVNRFSLRLLDQVASRREDSNIVISAVSVWDHLAVLSNAAAGLTVKELSVNLNLNSQFQSNYARIKEIMNENTDGVLLGNFEGTYIDENVNVRPEFLDLAWDKYNSTVTLVNVNNLEKVAVKVNYDVRAATGGEFWELVSTENLKPFDLMLVDAMSFKARWTHAFEKRDTAEGFFFDNERKQILGKVNMMTQMADHRTTNLKDIRARAIELTYGQDRKYSMVILTPDRGLRMREFIKILSQHSLKKIFDKLDKIKNPKAVNVWLPRFKVESENDLTPPLEGMGIKRIFDPIRAYLPGITTSELYVSTIIHNTKIEVTESGVWASNNGTDGFKTRRSSAGIKVDRPFVFLIVERESQLLLFSGVYNIPKVE